MRLWICFLFVVSLGTPFVTDRRGADRRDHHRHAFGRERRRAAGRLGDRAGHRHGSLAHGRDRGGGTVRRRRDPARIVRPARGAGRLQAPRAPGRDRRGRDDGQPEHHASDRRARDRGCRRRHDAPRQHVHVGAQLPRRHGSDRAASAQRPQLHRPRAAAARRQRVSAPRRRIGRRARARHERQRAGPAVEYLPARRHAAERFHEWAGRERRRHRARHGHDPRVPRRGQRLQRGVRPELGRADQRAHQVRRQHVLGERLRVSPQRRARLQQLLRRRREAGFPAEPVRRHARRTDRQGSRVLLRRLRGARRAARQERLDRRARRQRAPRDPARGIRRDQPRRGAVPGGVPTRQRSAARAGSGDAYVPVQPDGRSAFPPGPPGLPSRRQPPVLRPLHAGRRGSVSADRLPAVSADVSFPQSVLHRRIPPDPVRPDAQHGAHRFQPDADRPERPGEHDTDARAVHCHPRSDGRHRHRRHEALRAAELGQPAAGAERVQRCRATWCTAGAATR